MRVIAQIRAPEYRGESMEMHELPPVGAKWKPAWRGCGMASKPYYENNGEALLNGFSVAIDAGDACYVGSFQGDLVVKVPR